MHTLKNKKEAAKISLIFYFSISEMSFQHVINILKLLMKYFTFPFLTVFLKLNLLFYNH